MPEISRFFGITIKMFWNDHAPPHFHAEHGGERVVIEIETLAVTEGRLSPRATGLVMEWASEHQEDLRRAWKQARAFAPIDEIAPLK